MIRCVLFDMDGVLINTEPLHFRIWQQVAAENGVSLNYDHYKGCIGSTIGYLFDLIQADYGEDFHHQPQIISRYKEIKAAVVQKEGLPQVEGVSEVIRHLQQSGYCMAVASSSPQEYIELYIEKLGLTDCFDLLFSGERVEKPKPAPDVFLATAAELRIRPEECLVVEDSYNGLIAAKAAGMKCFGFQNPDSGKQDLSAADVVFYPFCELKNLL